ncbi:MAG: DUF2325 domain-containing protein [Hyphomicrobiaceae bacterium]
MRGNVQCSVVGTCLSENDLKKILERCRLKYEAGVPSYDVHGYFANAICRDCAVARAVQKLLDRRHEGIVRRVGRATSSDDLASLWDTEFAAGRIPGAYWAFLTHSHVSPDLHARVFGEVHMLSHLLGRTAQSTASRVSELEATVADLESKLSRMRTRHQQALDERDQTIAHLQKQVTDKQQRMMCVSGSHSAPGQEDKRAVRLAHRRERAISTARQRARAAEAQVERLQALLVSTGRSSGFGMSGGRVGDNHFEAGRLPSGNEPIRILYVGGRTGGIDRLRDIATGVSAELIHHDGGMEESVANLDRLLERCHAVFCPVVCVSHAACLRAKQLCRKHGKAFIPLRSSGGASFKRALEELRDGFIMPE